MACSGGNTVCFCLNTPKGTAKAPAVDLLRLNTIRGTKNHFFNPQKVQ